MSKTVTVHFEDVGRGKKRWSVDASAIPADDRQADGTPSEDWLAGAVRDSKALASRDVDVEFDDDEPGRFTILVGGFRPVGRGRVEVSA